MARIGRPRTAQCGTPAGFNRHYIDKTEQCQLCLDAHREKMRLQAADLRSRINEYKLRLGCKDCGYNKYAVALDFDHLRDKSFQISSAIANRPKFSTLMKEIEKCEVVCANCHRVRTSTRKGTINS